MTANTPVILRVGAARTDKPVVTTPPDDLPRSPTGRIPAWVYDELAGKPTGATAWRAPGAIAVAAPGLRATGRPGRPGREHPFRSFLSLVVCSALALSGWFAYQRYPNEAAALVASATNLTAATGVAAPSLPAASDRDYPAPGFEEADARLGVAVVVAGAAASSAHAFQQTQRAPGGGTVPVTWSPCRPIHVVIDPAGAPAGFALDVQLALGEVAVATGLVFTADSETTEPASSVRGAFLPTLYGDRWAPVLVRFADPATVAELTGDVAGLSTSQRVREPASGESHYVSGAVYLDSSLLSVPSDGPAPAYLAVLRHELGHLVGLDHVNDPTQLMNPVTRDVETFQAGDLTGLAALGAGECAPTI